MLDAAVGYLDGRAANLWPAARDLEGGFDWSLLCGADGPRPRARPSPPSTSAPTSTRRTATCCRCPGSAPYRLRADESGYENLALAGDWTETGLNAGCIEAATLGGLQAANSVLGRPLHARTSGFRPRERARA